MSHLIYSMFMSLDGYTADKEGNFDWAEPDEEVHTFANDLERHVGTHLYGRRMYETMLYWETAHTHPDQTPFTLDYADIWKAAEKIVYSTTLEKPSSARTRIEKDFNPRTIQQFKESTRGDISIGGPHLAAQAIRARVVDEYHLFIVPVVVGGGTRALPADVRLQLTLLDERRFGNGTLYLHYRSEA